MYRKTCKKCDGLIRCLGGQRLRYEKVHRMEVRRHQGIFITSKEIQKFRNDVRYSVVCPNRWSIPNRCMKELNVEKIVYIKDLKDDTYTVRYVVKQCEERDTCKCMCGKLLCHSLS